MITQDSSILRDCAEDRQLVPAMLNGARRRCPCCGEGALFHGFLKVRAACDVCGEELRHHRADDLPAFLSILIGGKVMILLLMISAKIAPFGDSAQFVWPAVGLALVLGILSPIKGAVVGQQWALRMHGFGDDDAPEGDPTLLSEGGVERREAP